MVSLTPPPPNAPIQTVIMSGQKWYFQETYVIFYLPAVSVGNYITWWVGTSNSWGRIMYLYGSCDQLYQSARQVTRIRLSRQPCRSWWFPNKTSLSHGWVSLPGHSSFPEGQTHIYHKVFLSYKCRCHQPTWRYATMQAFVTPHTASSFTNRTYPVLISHPSALVEVNIATHPRSRALLLVGEMSPLFSFQIETERDDPEAEVIY